MSYGKFVKTPRAAVLELRRTLSTRVRRREGRASFQPEPESRPRHTMYKYDSLSCTIPCGFVPHRQGPSSGFVAGPRWVARKRRAVDDYLATEAVHDAQRGFKTIGLA